MSGNVIIESSSSAVCFLCTLNLENRHWEVILVNFIRAYFNYLLIRSSTYVCKLSLLTVFACLAAHVCFKSRLSSQNFLERTGDWNTTKVKGIYNLFYFKQGKVNCRWCLIPQAKILIEELANGLEMMAMGLSWKDILFGNRHHFTILNWIFANI